MAPAKEDSPIFNIKISSVGPGNIAGKDTIQEPSNMDLAMKLHYLRVVYYFESPAFQGLNIIQIKSTLFNWLNHAFVTCGRFRRSESGRPYLKCNDCGVRLVEAQCDSTLVEWLNKENDEELSRLQKVLVPNKVIGPELPFSPPVYLQLTKFKCGGMAVGLSWSHVLGDAAFAADYMNKWGECFTTSQPAHPLLVAQAQNITNGFNSPTKQDPLSLKRVDPVGDSWIFTNSDCKMETFCFPVTPSQMSNLQSQISGQKDGATVPAFEALCAVIWQCVAKAKAGTELKVVTICRNGVKEQNKGTVSNQSQDIQVVKADVPIAEASVKELASLMVKQAVDEAKKIEDAMGREVGLADYIIYGANLTFVDLENIPLYELDVRGQKPIYMNYGIDGVGEEGVVLVLPAAPRNVEKNGLGGKMVSITLPEHQVLGVKSQLKTEWSIA